MGWLVLEIGHGFRSVRRHMQVNVGIGIAESFTHEPDISRAVVY
jgi:hypothetical protein